MRILFICKSNINRSQMAEGFLRAWAPHIEGMSAAADIPLEWEGRVAASFSDVSSRAMKEFGIDISRSYVKKISSSLCEEADIVVSMVTSDQLPDYLMNSPKLRFWNIEDPGGKSVEIHVETRNSIARNVRSLIEEVSPGILSTIAAFVIIVDARNRVLLQHRTADAPTNPSKWQLWGGAVEQGETPVETAIRELTEELALQISPQELIFFYRHLCGDNVGIDVFAINIGERENFTLGEGDAYLFYKKDDLHTLDLESTTKIALDAFYASTK